MKKILIIEDEAAVRETIVEILQYCNYEAIEASNGREGYEKAIELFPDLVICDMMMPRMNGIDTIKAFRNHSALKFIPFVFLSAMSELSDIRQGMNLGAEDYLTKPFNAKELLSVIDLQLIKVKESQKLSESVGSYRLEKVLKKFKQEAVTNEKKWKDCLKSAATIQSVILPKKAEIDSLFPNNFIFFKPKYNVSGDFYWCQDFGNIKLIAVADCTGHGISASLLTFCCYNGLNLAIKQYGLRKPKEIIEKVNEIVLNFMQEHGRTNNGVGMDVVICAINEDERTIIYAGAKRPLYYISNKIIDTSNQEVKEYKQKYRKSLYKMRGSPYTVGSKNDRVELTEHTINYESGDIIYLSTDGYSDQFGGPADKCFKSINLIQLLTSIQNENLKEQKNVIAQSFGLWKGNTEQTDDVTLMGIKLE